MVLSAAAANTQQQHNNNAEENNNNHQQQQQQASISSPLLPQHAVVTLVEALWEPMHEVGRCEKPTHLSLFVCVFVCVFLRCVDHPSIYLYLFLSLYSSPLIAGGA